MDRGLRAWPWHPRVSDLKVHAPLLSEPLCALGRLGNGIKSKHTQSVEITERTRWICSPLVPFRGKFQFTLEIVARCTSEA